jgi:hypothetical protein
VGEKAVCLFDSKHIHPERHDVNRLHGARFFEQAPDLCAIDLHADLGD